VSLAIIQPKLYPSKAKKPIIANCVSKLVAMAGNIPQYLWTPIQHMIHWIHLSPRPKRHLDRFSRLCKMFLYFAMGRPSPSKLPLHMGSGSPLIHGSLPTRVLNPNGISFLQFSLYSVTDRPTDRPTETDRPRYSVGNNRPHLHT